MRKHQLLVQLNVFANRCLQMSCVARSSNHIMIEESIPRPARREVCTKLHKLPGRSGSFDKCVISFLSTSQ
jgi:hypothetical protein